MDYEQQREQDWLEMRARRVNMSVPRYLDTKAEYEADDHEQDYMIECTCGHFFDRYKYDYCPECGVER